MSKLPDIGRAFCLEQRKDSIMTTYSTKFPPAQPLVLIVSPDSNLRIQLARMVARTSARALVVLNLDAAGLLLPSGDVVLALVDERPAGVHGLGIAQTLRQHAPDMLIVLLRDHVAGRVELVNGSIVVHSIADTEALQTLIADSTGASAYTFAPTPR